MFEVGFGGFSSMMGNIQMVEVREVGIVRRFLMFAGFMDIAASL